MSESIEVVRTGEKITLGRRDYGWGVEAELVSVAGESFALRGGRFYVECGNCDGGFSGSKRHFAHVLGAVCFQCNGRGHRKAVDSEADVIRIVKRRIADRARAERKRAEKEAAQVAEREAWVAANPEVAAALAGVMADYPVAPDGLPDYSLVDAWNAKWGGFVTDLANQAQFKALSEKQTAAALSAVAEAKAAQAEEAAVAAKQRYLDATIGAKVTVTGTIAVAATIETRFGGSRLVIVEGSGEHEGVTVKMFGSGKSLWEVAKGDAVEVTGTVKDFSEYDGVPQTELTRAKVKVLTEAH